MNIYYTDKPMENITNYLNINENPESMTGSSKLIDVERSTSNQSSQHMLQQESFLSNMPENFDYCAMSDRLATSEQEITSCVSIAEHKSTLHQMRLNSHQPGGYQRVLKSSESQAKVKKARKGRKRSETRLLPPAKFVEGNHTYNFYNVTMTSRMTSAVWRCDRRGSGCKARIHTNVRTKEVIKRINGHNHGSSSKEVVLKRLKALVKIKALQTNFHPDLVLKSSKKELGIKIRLKENQRNNLKKIIKRERALKETTPPFQQLLFVDGNIDVAEPKKETDQHHQNSQQCYGYGHNSCPRFRNEEDYYNYGDPQRFTNNPRDVKPVEVFAGNSCFQNTQRPRYMAVQQQNESIDELTYRGPPIEVHIIQDGPLKIPCKKRPFHQDIF